jgi:hypothetical protein
MDDSLRLPFAHGGIYQNWTATRYARFLDILRLLTALSTSHVVVGE